MPTTYEPIATTTLGSAATTYTFSSIPATYTDLKLILTLRSTGAYGGNTGLFYFNGNNTGSLYSETWLKGNGTAASSSRSNGNPYFANTLECPAASSAANLYSFVAIEIFNYAGSTNKTVLSETSNDKNGSGSVYRAVHLWRNTAAITSVSIGMGAGEQLAAGTTATLYGIKNA
jgi:hypothetical protein